MKNMRNRWLTASLVASALLPLGCGLIQFDVNTGGDSQVPGCTNPISCGLLSQLGFSGFSNFDISQSTAWQNNNATKDQVSSATFTAAALDVTVPDGGDMSFIQSLQFFVAAPDAGQVLVAEGHSFPAGQSHVPLTTHPEVELAPYVKASSMTITTNASGSQPQQGDTTIHASLTFHVKL
jgi:hypothetical protein